MTFTKIKEALFKAYDEKNAKFFQKISPVAKNITGVKVPYLRKVAKDIIKDNPLEFLDNYKISTHEELLLKGIVIAYIKKSFTEKLPYIKEYVPEIYDWSSCDIFVSSFKFKEDELKVVYSFIMEYKNSSKEYEVRFFLVMLLSFFIKEEYLGDIKDILDNIKLHKYYDKMAAAWLIATMFTKFRDFTLSYLQNNNLDKETYDKALQKMCESNKISKEDKAIIRGMKAPKPV